MTTYTTYEKAGKKSYEAPRLVVYGDVREITQSRHTGNLAADGSNSGDHNTA